MEKSAAGRERFLRPFEVEGQRYKLAFGYEDFQDERYPEDPKRCRKKVYAFLLKEVPGEGWGPWLVESAVCSRQDRFDKKVGRHIAFLRLVAEVVETIKSVPYPPPQALVGALKRAYFTGCYTPDKAQLEELCPEVLQ